MLHINYILIKLGKKYIAKAMEINVLAALKRVLICMFQQIQQQYALPILSAAVFMNTTSLPERQVSYVKLIKTFSLITTVMFVTVYL